MISISIILLVVMVFVSSLTQIMLKKEANKKTKSIVRKFINFNVLFSYFIYFVIAFINVFLYRNIDYGVIIVVESFSYVFILLLSRVILKEKITKLQILGVLLINIGIYLYI